MLEPPDRPATWEDVTDALQALDTSRTRVLDDLRAVLVVGEAAPTDGLARELRGRGGRVALIDAGGRGIEEAREIDPVILLVDPGALEGSGAGLAQRLRDDPRLRWASVVRAAFAKAWPHGLPRLAGQIAPLVERDRALRAHVAERSPFRCDLERIGPNRALRAVEGLGQALELTTTSAGAVAEIVVADELLVSASWWETGPASARLTGVDALAAFLTMRRGRLEVQPGARLVGANVLMPVAEALHEAGQQMLGVMAQVPTARYPRPAMERTRQGSDALRADDEVTTQRYPAVRAEDGRAIRRSGVPRRPAEQATEVTEEENEATPRRLVRPMLRPPAPSPAPPDRGARAVAPRPEMPRRVRPSAPRAPMETHPPRRPATPPPPRPAPALASRTPRPSIERPPVKRAGRPVSPSPELPPVGRPSPTPDPVAEAPPLPPPRAPQPASLRPVSFEARRPEPGAWPLRIVTLAAAAVALTAVGYLVAHPPMQLPSAERIDAAPTAAPGGSAVPADRVERTPTEPAPVEGPAHAPRGRAGAEPTDVAAVEGGAEAIATNDLPTDDRRAARELVERGRSQGSSERARELFEAALERNPQEPRAMAGLADIHLARGESTEAVGWARRALAISPRRASYHVLLGDALEAAGRSAEARRAWRRADALAPGRARIHRRLTHMGTDPF